MNLRFLFPLMLVAMSTTVTQARTLDCIVNPASTSQPEYSYTTDVMIGVKGFASASCVDRATGELANMKANLWGLGLAINVATRFSLQCFGQSPISGAYYGGRVEGGVFILAGQLGTVVSKRGRACVLKGLSFPFIASAGGEVLKLKVQ